MKNTKINLQLLAYDPQEQPDSYTGATGLSAEMKTFYDMRLIDEASPMLVHEPVSYTHLAEAIPFLSCPTMFSYREAPCRIAVISLITDSILITIPFSVFVPDGKYKVKKCMRFY